MNNCILLVKIVKEPQQVYFDKDTIAIEALISFRCSTNYDAYTFAIATFLGSSGTILLKYYKKNDYIIVEGNLRFKRMFLDGNKGKDLEISVLNFHPFLISDD